MNEHTDVSTNKVNERTYGRMNESSDGKTDKKKRKQMYEQTNWRNEKQTNKQKDDGQTYELTKKWKPGLKNEVAERKQKNEETHGRTMGRSDTNNWK